jgi:superfamily II DNA helicase RecQ
VRKRALDHPKACHLRLEQDGDAMQFKFFMIPASNAVEAEAELNAFVRSHRVLTVNRQLVADGQASYWAVAVEYLDGKPGQGKAAGGGERSRVDYKDVLDEQQFAVFSRLRDLRKEIAETEGLPIYVIFTNEQLAEMVRSKVTSKAAMSKIEGVGEGKVTKYAERFLAVLAEGSK